MCFINQNSSQEFERVLPKEHFCDIWFKSPLHSEENMLKDQDVFDLTLKHMTDDLYGGEYPPKFYWST